MWRLTMKNKQAPVGYKNFNTDLFRAKKAEQEILDVLMNICGESVLEVYWSDKLPEYDVKLKTIFGQVKIEMKCDYSHAKYGNVAVEYWSRGKPSGIMITEADYWIYRIYEKDGTSGMYLIKTTDLVLMISNHMYKDRVEDVGDRGSGTCIFLFEGAKFKYCSRLLHTFKE